MEWHKDSWVNGSYVGSLSAEYIARNSAAQGYCNACNEMLEITLEELLANE